MKEQEKLKKTLFCRIKGSRHCYPNRRTAKHGILLDQKWNSKRIVTFEIKRLSFSKAKVRATREDHSDFKILPLRRHRTITRKARSNRAKGK